MVARRRSERRVMMLQASKSMGQLPILLLHRYRRKSGAAELVFAEDGSCIRLISTTRGSDVSAL